MGDFLDPTSNRRNGVGRSEFFGIAKRFGFQNIYMITGKLTAASLHLKIGRRAPKGNGLVFQSSILRWSVPPFIRRLTLHEVTDYLLPSPTRRHDAALRAMVGLDVLGDLGNAPNKNTKGPHQ